MVVSHASGSTQEFLPTSPLPGNSKAQLGSEPRSSSVPHPVVPTSPLEGHRATDYNGEDLECDTLGLNLVLGKILHLWECQFSAPKMGRDDAPFGQLGVGRVM